MKLLATAALAAVLLVSACGGTKDTAAPETSPTNAADALAALFSEHFERNLEMNPLSATFIGDYRYNDRMANSNSPEYRAAAMAMDEEFLGQLLEIDRGQLGYQDQLSYDLFRIKREQSLEGYRFPFHLAPINQFYSLTSMFVQLGSGSSAHPFKTVKDYDDFLSRADQFAINVDQVITNMKQGMREGVVQPRILMAKLVPQLQSQVVDDPKDSGFYTPVRDMPAEFSEAERARLTGAYEDKISNTVIPAYERLNNFIGDDYLAAARESVGLSALPNGEEWYAYMVRLRTTTDMTPEEIHQIGLDEVARIHGEMRSVIEEVGFEGDLQDFFEFVNTDEQFFFDDAEQLIQGYRDMTDHITELSRNLFEIFPKTAFEVRRVETFREKSAAGGSLASRGVVSTTR